MKNIWPTILKYINMKPELGYTLSSRNYPEFNLTLKPGFNTVIDNFTADSSNEELFSIGVAPDYLNTKNEVYLFASQTLILMVDNNSFNLNKNSAFYLSSLNSEIEITVNEIAFYISDDSASINLIAEYLAENYSPEKSKAISDNASKKKDDMLKDIKATLKKYKESPNKDVCPICLKQRSAAYAELECKHWFCYECILQWTERANICPMCKRGYSKIYKVCNGVIISEKKVNPLECLNVFTCYVCKSIEDAENMLICHECGVLCHQICNRNLNPAQDWVCDGCISH